MLRHKPKRKLLLPAGIISLSLLSFLCIEFILQQRAQRNSLRALELVALDTTVWGQFNPYTRLAQNITKIRLTGAINDENKLRFVKQAVHRIVLKNDTTTGFEFTFGDHAKYASLVELHSICKAENVPSFFYRGDKFWIFNVHPKPSSYRGICGNIRHTTVILTQENAMGNFKWILSARFISCMALLFLFFLMIVAVARKTIKKPN